MKLAILSEEKERIKSFLESLDLKYNEQDYSFYMEDGGRVIATVSVKGNIIQGFGIAPEYRGENLAGRMISEVLGFLSEKKIYRLKVYTKPENSEVFKALGFSEIISTTNISLLETPTGTIWNVLNDLKSEYNVVEDDIGCAVLNANPFTLGHRYLVETASKRHQRFLVFVLEEDLSFFKFNDRIRLVRAGTADLKNVSVLPSSPYLVSALTFPTYFLKQDVDEVAEQALSDALIFKKYFLPVFGIKMRYLGTETDPVTFKYNRALEEVLGEKLTIITRREAEPGTISASLVRKLLREKDFRTLEKLVPKTTLEFLKTHE
jgi:[citrate (pro-3S)-lyase] ligase